MHVCAQVPIQTLNLRATMKVAHLGGLLQTCVLYIYIYIDSGQKSVCFLHAGLIK